MNSKNGENREGFLGQFLDGRELDLIMRVIPAPTQ